MITQQLFAKDNNSNGEQVACRLPFSQVRGDTLPFFVAPRICPPEKI